MPMKAENYFEIPRFLVIDEPKTVRDGSRFETACNYETIEVQPGRYPFRLLANDGWAYDPHRVPKGYTGPLPFHTGEAAVDVLVLADYVVNRLLDHTSAQERLFEEPRMRTKYVSCYSFMLDPRTAAYRGTYDSLGGRIVLGREDNYPGVTGHLDDRSYMELRAAALEFLTSHHSENAMDVTRDWQTTQEYHIWNLLNARWKGGIEDFARRVFNPTVEEARERLNWTPTVYPAF